MELVVLHYTGMQSGEIALKRLTDPAPVAGAYPGPWQAGDLDPQTPLARVSAHYVVDEDSTIYRLVPEEMRAWHAGRGAWLGEDQLNERSIGIEIVNGGHDFGLPPFADGQIIAVIALLRDILKRHALAPRAVIGHSDLAPGRKLDPGEKFPWHLLEGERVAVGPRAAAPGGPRLAEGDAGEVVRKLQSGLQRFGYDIAPTGAFDAHTKIVVEAFQRRFRRSRVDGIADDQTWALLNSLLAEYG